MTDLATIRIPVDSSDMVNAVRDANALESSIKTLFKAYDSGAIGAGQFQKGLLQLNTKFKDLFTNSTEANSKIVRFATSLVAAAKAIEQSSEMRSWFSAQRRRIALMQESERIAKRQADEEAKAAEKIAAAQEKATQAIIKQRDAAEQAATVRASNFQAGIGTNLGLGAQGISASASADAFSQEIDKLRQKYDKVYVASQLYQQQLEEITQAERFGILSKQQYQKQLDALNAEYEQFANSAENAYIANNRFSQHINATSRGLNNFGFVAQQVGYQVGDFFVQVQSGTNVLVAFGQQATQLAGLIPGIWGAAIGIGISLVTALGSALMKASEAADGSKKALEEYQGVLESLNSSISDTSLSLEALRRGVEPDKIFESTLAIQDLISTLDTLRNTPIEGFMDAFTRADRIIAAQALKVELEKALETLREQQAEEQRLETAATRRANEVRNQYREQFKEAEKLKQTLFQSLGTLEKMAKVNLSNVFSSASPFAQGLLNTVKDIYGKMLAAANVKAITEKNARESEDYSGRGGDPRDFMEGGSKSYDPNFRPFDPSMVPEPSKGGGGIGPSEDTINNKLEEVYRYLEITKYQIEQENIAYSQRQETLEQALKDRLLTQQEYNQLELDLAARHAKELADIDNASKAQKLSTVLGSGAQILSAIGEHNEKAAKMARIFGAAQALADTYAGAAAALKLPFPANLAAASSIIAAGLGFVNAIKSGSTSARPSGGSIARGSASVSASSGRAPTPQTVFINSIDPESLYSGQTLINLFDAFYDENDKRGKVFVVAR